MLTARLLGRAVLLLPVLVLSLSLSAWAQAGGLPTAQVQNFLCQLVGSLQGLAPFILMTAVAAALGLALVAKKGSLVGDLVGAMIIAIILINLHSVLAAFGINGC